MDYIELYKADGQITKQPEEIKGLLLHDWALHLQSIKNIGRADNNAHYPTAAGPLLRILQIITIE